mmetsp:Transcript_29983/g.78646  ORF Transcript_29983/g.78646 Transcript_29983/m.78646 type:complete len:202 (-) Transcript_29983:2266-2871(-)
MISPTYSTTKSPGDRSTPHRSPQPRPLSVLNCSSLGYRRRYMRSFVQLLPQGHLRGSHSIINRRFMQSSPHPESGSHAHSSTSSRGGFGHNHWLARILPNLFGASLTPDRMRSSATLRSAWRASKATTASCSARENEGFLVPWANRAFSSLLSHRTSMALQTKANSLVPKNLTGNSPSRCDRRRKTSGQSSTVTICAGQNL